MGRILLPWGASASAYWPLVVSCQCLVERGSNGGGVYLNKREPLPHDQCEHLKHPPRCCTVQGAALRCTVLCGGHGKAWHGASRRNASTGVHI
ncbi:hypothetical protein E2C01_040674 [Portunus trituberculatus]|uniref:Secreted protein n=1 Tax=Portunus trituberculatus TaxID=210409 RepID=A0A5B7FKF0_PORTR|nr:hypothetical protein [Portunus trituberculatus]